MNRFPQGFRILQLRKEHATVPLRPARTRRLTGTSRRR
jgi:hypothetical protein